MYWLNRFYNFVTGYLPLLKTNYKFVQWNEPRPVPPLNEYAFENYRKVIDHAFRKHLFGWDREYIISTFHRAEPTQDLIYTAIGKGDLPDHPVPFDEHFERARTRCRELFAPPEPIRPVHFADLRHYPWKGKPSAEEPYVSDGKLRQVIQDAARMNIIADGRMSVHNLKNHIFIDVRDFIHSIKQGTVKPGQALPLVNVHVKTALTTLDESKLRIIFGCSKRWILPMAMFLWPLFRYYIQEQNSPLLWGYETILGGWHRMNSELLARHLYYQTYLTIDWSGFDLRALFSVMRLIYADWKTYFVFDNGYLPTKKYPHSSCNPQKLHNLWDWCVEAHFASRFRLPDGSTWIRLHRGILSGLFETQFLDSHYNLLMILTILDRMGFDISNLWIKIQGDDSISAMRIHIPASQHDDFKIQFQYWAKYYFDHKVNLTKSGISNTLQDVEVLGYKNNNGIPYRDWRSILAVLWNPRSRRPQPSTTMSRCIGLAYASIYDPNVVNVCKDVFDYYHSLGYSANPRGFGELEFLISELEVPHDHFPTHLEVTRYLRSLNNVSDKKKREYWNPDWFLSTF
jgi:hypothetical protein